MKLGQLVNFLFQGKWNVSLHGQTYQNVGKVHKIRDKEIVVKSPNGAKYYLNEDMVREVGKSDEKTS